LEGEVFIGGNNPAGVLEYALGGAGRDWGVGFFGQMEGGEQLGGGLIVGRAGACGAAGLGGLVGRVDGHVLAVYWAEGVFAEY